MAGNLDKLSSDDLFLLLSEKVDQEAAAAIRDQRISGSTLVDLTDTELKDLLPKLGPRKMVKRLVDNFQSDGSSQPKVKHSHYSCMHSLAVPNHATSVIKFHATRRLVPHSNFELTQSLSIPWPDSSVNKSTIVLISFAGGIASTHTYLYTR